ncbi:MAG: exo-alpha-sialidase [Clostridia bacterium]|nr:exo-alpha-sialidase [Clostridia bacterium]
MKPVSGWSYTPYAPPFFDAGDPYICRLVPGTDSLHLEWLDKDNDTYTVSWRKRGEETFSATATVTGDNYTIQGLTEGEEYEVQVSHGEKKSRIRLARAGKAVGTVVNYLHPEDPAYRFSGQYLCSPSMVRHPDGYLLASMDLFAPHAPQNLTLIFRSDDDGETWHYVSELFPCFWGKMFIHKGELYMFATSTEYGDLLIGKSTDGGKTFSTPTVLLRGSCKCNVAGVHKNPQPVIYHNGRLWITHEWGSWGEGYHAPMMASIPEDADPLEPSNWTFTDPIKYDPKWVEGFISGPSSGNIEGSPVVLPDGKLYNIMRYDMTKCTPDFGYMLAFRVNTDDPEAPLEYDRPIALPGNHSKSIILHDEKSGYYYSIISRIIDSEHKHARNLLSLMKSKDCEHWELVCDLLDYLHEDPQKIGFQYVDPMIEGDDMIYLCRTGINGANSYHNTNYSTFHRIQNFREL